MLVGCKCGICTRIHYPIPPCQMRAHRILPERESYKHRRFHFEKVLSERPLEGTAASLIVGAVCVCGFLQSFTYSFTSPRSSINSESQSGIIIRKCLQLQHLPFPSDTSFSFHFQIIFNFLFEILTASPHTHLPELIPPAKCTRTHFPISSINAIEGKGEY